MLGSFERSARIGRVLSAYVRRKTVLKYPPYALWVEPTNLCNLACVMCANVDLARSEQGYMSMDLFRKIIDEAGAFVFDIKLFLGGESLLHKDLGEMIAYAKARKIKVNLNTNATLLTQKTAEILLESGLDVLTLSFDGYEKQVYESIRVKADFEKTLNRILGFLEEKKRRGSRKPYTVFQVIEFNDPETRSPEEVKRSFLRKFEGLPLDRLTTIQAHNFGGRLTRMDEGKLRDRSDIYTPCTFLWYSMSILWDGRVVPCCIDFKGAYPLGDVKTQSLREVWNGEPLVGLRRKIAEMRYEEVGLCKDCDVLFRPKILGMPIRSLKGAWSLLAGNES